MRSRRSWKDLPEGAWREEEAKGNSIQIILMDTGTWHELDAFLLLSCFLLSSLSKENGVLTKPKLYENSSNSLLLAFCFTEMLSFLTMRERLTSFFPSKTSSFRRISCETKLKLLEGGGRQVSTQCHLPHVLNLSGWLLSMSSRKCKYSPEQSLFIHLHSWGQ